MNEKFTYPKELNICGIKVPNMSRCRFSKWVDGYRVMVEDLDNMGWAYTIHKDDGSGNSPIEMSSTYGVYGAWTITEAKEAAQENYERFVA